MADPLFKGMTRPAMMLGVTYSALIINAGLSLILFLAINHILALLIFVPIHAAMYLVCLWDERFFDILIVYVRTKGGDGSRSIYKASSYRP